MDFELFCEEVKDIITEKEVEVEVVDHIYPATWFEPEEICSHTESMSFSKIFDYTLGYEETVEAIIRDEAYDLLDDRELVVDDVTIVAEKVYKTIIEHYMDELYEALNNYDYRLNDYVYC
jgi:hypothetical protein